MAPGALRWHLEGVGLGSFVLGEEEERKEGLLRGMSMGPLACFIVLPKVSLAGSMGPTEATSQWESKSDGACLQ